jgi:FemAB-related protein (PEP-CTERM system-associated)
MTSTASEALEVAAVETTRAPLTVEAIGPGGGGVWDDLVRALPDGSPFHLLGWRRAVARTFGLSSAYLLARRGNRIVGLLPLFETNLLFGRRALVSVPFGIRGGVLADERDAALALVDEARKVGERQGAEYVELRSARDPWSPLPRREGYVTFRADLREDEGALLRRMDRKRRQMITHGDRAGYRVRVAGHEELPAFYRLYALSMRRHGTPVHSPRFVEALAREMPDEVRLFFLERAGQLVMATLALVFAGTLTPFWAGRDDERARAAEETLYWGLMRWGREQGLHTFDFGRSRRGTGAAAFKRRWGMEEEALDYRFLPLRSADGPSLDPGNPRFRTLIAAWRRLPLPVTRLLGPPLAWRIP